MLAVPAVTTWNVFGVLSTSVSVSVPVAVGVPGVPLATPPASVTAASDRAGDHRGVVGAVDGDVHHLGGAVRRRDRDVVGQRAAGVERLHRRVAVVRACRSRHRPPSSRRYRSHPCWPYPPSPRKVFGVLSTSASVSVPVAVDVPGVPLERRSPRSPRRYQAGDHRRVVGAVDRDVDLVARAVRRRHRDQSCSVPPVFSAWTSRCCRRACSSSCQPHRS